MNFSRKVGDAGHFHDNFTLRGEKLAFLKKKKPYILILGYSAVVALSYSLPIGLRANEWYSFYDYLAKYQAVPFVDVREGYPPIGFLIYLPLYYVSNNNVEVFSYLFRAVNGTLLCFTLTVLYLIFKLTVGAGKGAKLLRYYALLPSVVIANAYSNDIVALFPAILAIYMMVRRKPTLCGFMLGVATLAKGFPFLLVIPALIAFPRKDEKIKVLGVTLSTIVLASMPFLLLNPFTYISTFTHVGSRGPWETIWALIDGYYSHGGLLHPYFDKFFYHFNLLKVYPANHFDHAIYKWRFNFIPPLLSLGQILLIFVISLVYIRRKNEVVTLGGLLYIAYMLFFKGYSTQFAVSTPAYLLLAVAEDNPTPYIISLEISHLLQMISWGTPIIGLESLRNWHLPMLIFAILLRTGTFSYVVFRKLDILRINLKSNISYLFSSLFSYARVFRDATAVLLLAATIVASAFCLCTLIGLEETSTLKFYEGDILLSPTDWSYINIDNLRFGDQVIVKFNTHTWLYAEVVPNDLDMPIERGLRNPFNLKGAFDETLLFFVAESQSYSLKLKMAHPAIPFRVTRGFEEDLRVKILRQNSSIVLKLKDYVINGRDSIFRMAFPMNFTVDNDFSLILKYNVIEGNVSTFFDVFSDTDDWLYIFKADENFILNQSTVDMLGCSNLRNDRVSLGALTLLIEDGCPATVKIDGIRIRKNSQDINIELYVEDTELVHYQIFVEKDWKPSLSYRVSLLFSVTFYIIELCYLNRKLKQAEQLPNIK